MKGTDLFVAQPAARRWTWALAAPLLGAAMAVLSQFIGYPLLVQAGLATFDGGPKGLAGLAGLLLLPFGLLLGIQLAWLRWFERRSVVSSGWTGQAKLQRLVIGMGAGMFCLAAVLGLLLLVGGLVWVGPPTAWSSGTQVLGLLLLLPCFALQGSVEELVFRGWMLSVVARRYGTAAGVLLSSVPFALLHFNAEQPVLALTSTFLIGVALALWVVRARSLLGAMGWHAGWNWLLAVGFGLPLSGIDAGLTSLVAQLQPAGPAWLSGGAQGPEGSMVSIGLTLLAIIVLLIDARRPRRRDASSPIEV